MAVGEARYLDDPSTVQAHGLDDAAGGEPQRRRTIVRTHRLAGGGRTAAAEVGRIKQAGGLGYGGRSRVDGGRAVGCGQGLAHGRDESRYDAWHVRHGNGFHRAGSIAGRPTTASVSSPLAVSMTIGIRDVRGSAR